ncbi:MAG: hypothetical protein HY800_00735 [Ignavibacteriales bacterium]|nr:hypothetical protein [Ignavibacteriales bacterium]
MESKIDVNKILIEKLIVHPSERPLPGIFRNIILGIIIGIFLTIIGIFRGWSGWHEIISYFICGILISFFGWGAERLWYSIVAGMMQKPFSMYAYLTRLPLWWIAGGIGYTIGMLFSLKMNFIYINDIPVKNIFFYGGFIGILFQGIMQFRVIRLLGKSS